MNVTYYIDAINGKDSNQGKSPDSPWRSLDPANQVVLAPGDRLLLRRGDAWRGMLSPKGSGLPQRPITLGTYGEGPLPIVDAEGGEAAIKLTGQSHWIIENIHVQNRATDRVVRQGIFLYGAEGQIVRDVVVRNCEVSHVVGQNRRQVPPYTSMYWNGGIYVSVPGRSSESNHWEDVLIENNYIHDVYTSGIRVAQREDGIIDIYHKNVVVRQNKIERTGSDGMIIANCIAPLIEENTCYDAGALGTLEDTYLIAGIWVCSVSDAIIRRNEVARTRLFDNDGTAFDTDWGVKGTIVFEENYSHENYGGFFLDCGGLNLNPQYEKTILRNNVSINDYRCIVQDAHSPHVELEGNVFYQDPQNEQITLCLYQPGTQHQYKDNRFFLTKEPKEGWQSVDLKTNQWVSHWKEAPVTVDGFSQIEKWKNWFSKWKKS
ncbi:MAG: hypothetical protein GX786_10435 [Clostridiales bacterium]|nr:hypothetical protein [Clostridiales bacterium]